jgi:hypothetical protein
LIAGRTCGRLDDPGRGHLDTCVKTFIREAIGAACWTGRNDDPFGTNVVAGRKTPAREYAGKIQRRCDRVEHVRQKWAPVLRADT